MRASGPVDPREAWERYMIPARWPGWSPQIRRVECYEERLTSGATGRVFGPLRASVDFAVESVDEVARTWTWTAHRGPLRLRLEHGVEAFGRGTATWLKVSGLLPVILAYAPAAQWALHRLVTISDTGR